MICQNCKQREATAHVKRIVNGEAAQLHLCSACAAKLGFGMSLGDFFGSFFSETPVSPAPAVTRCETCGASFQDIANSGMTGCADCYRTFYEQLLPSLHRIHGKMKHAGKRPEESLPETGAQRIPVRQADGQQTGACVQDRISRMKQALSEAVDAQEFERAAQLRDAIQVLEKEACGDE